MGLDTPGTGIEEVSDDSNTVSVPNSDDDQLFTEEALVGSTADEDALPSRSLELITIYRVGEIDRESSPALAHKLRRSRTKLKSATGYMVSFSIHAEAAGNISSYESALLPGQSYPLSESALNSLPAYIRAEIEQNDGVQLVAVYDTTESVFEYVRLAREYSEMGVVEYIAFLRSRGLSLQEAIDHVAVTETEQYTSEQWARIRDVRERTIQSNCDTAEEALTESNEKSYNRQSIDK